MHKLTLCFVITALIFICNDVHGKKNKKNKQSKDQVEFTTIKPNVVAYSTFGYNDVSLNDGFVPTLPNYSGYPSGFHQESSTRLYAPAFPSATDSTGFSGNYGSQLFDGQTPGDDNTFQVSMSQYPSNSVNFLTDDNANNFDPNEKAESQDINNIQSENSDTPIYGTKINNKHKSKYRIKHPELDISNSEYSNLYNDKYFNVPATEHMQENPVINDSNNKNVNGYHLNYVPHHEMNDYNIPDTTNLNSGVNFPRVVDFSELNNKLYATELDTSKLISDSIKHSDTQIAMAHSQIAGNVFNANNFVEQSPTSSKEYYKLKNKDHSHKNVINSHTNYEPDSNKALHYKYNEPNVKKNEQKQKIKHKPWSSGNYSNVFTNGKDSSSSFVDGYAYSTNYSHMNFKYGISEPTKPNNDELLSESSNVIDLTNDQFSDHDYKKFKKMPEFNYEGDHIGETLFRDKNKSGGYSNQYENSLNAPTSTNPRYRNTFKSTDYSIFEDHHKSPLYSNHDVIHDDVVNIPRRPHNLFTKYTQNKPSDWSASHYKSQMMNKPIRDWTKDFLDTRYKSEEDLLGLRTHDTSRPSYLPTYKPANNIIDGEHNDFKQLVDKWKESYFNSKYTDSRDNVQHRPEKLNHMSVTKSHPIEVPHPVIVPVPRPFPVRVPISKPVAIPVVRELTVQIEKPVPYPVYKNVLYPVEKLVPVPVEKEVTVHVDQPYPVHFPYVRPVFHHTKPMVEDPEHIDGEDYHRPEIRKPSPNQMKYRPGYSSSRDRLRRPIRASYRDQRPRPRRRLPDYRRRPSSYTSENDYNIRPYRSRPSIPYGYNNFEHDMDEDDYSRYRTYCRKIGTC